MLTLSAHNKKSFSTQPANDVIAASEISPKPDKMKVGTLRYLVIFTIDPQNKVILV